MTRLFTFGCSFTNYHWPTWADILEPGYDEYHNWARPGAGNQFIFERLVEADITFGFTPDDTIIVMWSSHNRHDWYDWFGWQTKGNVLDNPEFFDKAYLDRFYDIKASIMHSFNYIHAAQQLLENKHSNWKMTSMDELVKPVVSEEYMIPKLIKKLTSNEFSTFKEWPELLKYESILTGSNWLSMPLKKYMDNTKYKYTKKQGDTWDFHPTPIIHYNWLVDQGFEVTDEGKDLAVRWENEFVDAEVDIEASIAWLANNGIPHLSNHNKHCI